MFDSIINSSEFLSDHWLAEAFPSRLATLTKKWAEREGKGESTPHKALASTSLEFTRLRVDMPSIRDPEYAGVLTALHTLLLDAMGYDPSPQTMRTFHADTEIDVPLLLRAQVNGAELLHVLQAHPADSDDYLLSDDALLLDPILENPDHDKPKKITTVSDAVSLLFLVEDAPRFVMVIAANWVLLTDAERWTEGRYLAFDIETALSRRDTKASGELAWHAGLWSADVLLPSEGEATAQMAAYSEDSIKHAVGVSEDLREGLRRSVELIANEVLVQRRAKGLPVDGIDELPREITQQSLRFLYRILFLLFAEARPELGILPVGAPEYGAGYGIDRLRELVQVQMSPQAAKGHHFHDSLDVLFRLVNEGHGQGNTDSDGLVFEPLKADLFSEERVNHIDSIRLSNAVLQQVLEMLLLSRQSSKKGKQRGYVSYAQLGINQLGAVYEGLMAYTGFIAERDLVELAKDGDPSKGTWMVPAEDVGNYDAKHLVMREDPVTGAKQMVIHKSGTFVYRLTGRDRQRSASYYTPEILTRTVVKHALAELVTEDTTAAEILEYRVCEPALGSGAFLNEAINQLAAEYLHRRQRELDKTIEPTAYQGELQKVKAFLALHRVYGVDLNATAVELAEVSMWLNVMHPGLQAPWFGLHLRRGNSLIGARRATYNLASTNLRKSWHSTPPTDRPLSGDALGPSEVHHFLLPAAGWGAAGDAKEAKELAPVRAEALRTWAKATRRALGTAEVKRLTGLAQRVERLWALARRRLEISEHEIARTVDVWEDPVQREAGGVARRDVENGLNDPDGPYQRLRLAMDAWCALFFWPVTDGTPEPPRLDQWIATLESLLGVTGKRAPEGQYGFHDLPKDFHALGQLDDDELSWHGMTSTAELIASTPWLAQARDIAQREGFFHWELDFASVFAVGGFDLQIGNPPWVRPNWEEGTVLAEFDPHAALLEKPSPQALRSIRSAVLGSPGLLEVFTRELSDHAGMAASVSSPAEHELLGGVQTNLYLLFIERAWRSSHILTGIVGLVHPENHFSEPAAAELRCHVYARLRRHWQFRNEAKLFAEIGNTRSYGISVYGPPRKARFLNASMLFVPETIEGSLRHDGSGPLPGIKTPDGHWDVRPHASRIVEIDSKALAVCAELFDKPGTPALSARLLRPVVKEQMEAIAVLASAQRRMADTGYEWTRFWDEDQAKRDGILHWGTVSVDSIDAVVLQGPMFFPGTPFRAQPNIPCRNPKDYETLDADSLPADFVPRTNYQLSRPRHELRKYIPKWSGRFATDYWRVAWRRMVDPATERTLVAALVPPGPAHVGTVLSLTMPSMRETGLVAALWASIPMDFMVKVSGRTDVHADLVERMPAPLEGHPACDALLTRILRLSCMTSVYSSLWDELSGQVSGPIGWTGCFSGLATLEPDRATWTADVPLRSDYARRAALVEIDALSALMLGLSGDHLSAMYTGQMAVLRKYEYRMWFDANGRAISQDHAAKGARQQDHDFKNLQSYLAGEACGDLLDRYKPPFRQPNREVEMRAAYAEFKERLGL